MQRWGIERDGWRLAACAWALMPFAAFAAPSTTAAPASGDSVVLSSPSEIPFVMPDTDEEMFPWQFQIEADARYTQFIESKKEVLLKRLAAKPDDPGTLTKLGRLNYYQILSRRVELVPETMAIFERVLALRPEDAVALSYHGSLLLWSDYLSTGGQKGHTPALERGLKELSRAIEMKPNDLEVRTMRAFALIYGQDSSPERWMAVTDLQRAIDILENTYHVGPDGSADLRLSLGDVLFSLGRIREAQAQWQSVQDHAHDASKRTAAEVRLRYRQGLTSSQRADWKDVLALLGLLLGIVSLGVVASQPLRRSAPRGGPLAGVAFVVGAAGVAALVLLIDRMMHGSSVGPAALGKGALVAIAIAIAATGLALLRVTREPLADAILKRGTVAALFAVAMVALFQYVLAPASWGMAAAGAGALFTVIVAAVWTILAVSFPFVQRGVSRFVDRRLFHREESTRFLGRLGSSLAAITSEPELLAFVERELRDYLRVRHVHCARLDTAEQPLRDELKAFATAHPETLVRAGLGDGPLDAATQAWGRIQRALLLRPAEGAPVAVLIGDGHSILSGEDEVLSLVARQLTSTLENLRLHADVRQRAVAQESLARLATQAELRALRAQIHPHFLFNTLNSIAGLIQIEPRRAEELVEELAELLRYRFRAGRDFIPLSEELSLVTSYLNIEQVRLGTRMRVERDVTPEALAVPVPPLVLQPLVENAVTHGIARKVGGGKVRIAARIDGEHLELRVEDDGAGMASREDTEIDAEDGEATPSYGGNGVGLPNVLARLQRIYGNAASAEVQSAVGAGTQIVLRLPVVPPAPIDAPAPEDTHETAA